MATLTQTAMTLLFGNGADARVPNLGASGAIAAVLGAYFVLYPNSTVFGLIVFFPVRISAWFFLGFWFLYQLFEANFGLLEPGATAAAPRSSPTSAASSSASWWPGCWCTRAGSRARSRACRWAVRRERRAILIALAVAVSLVATASAGTRTQRVAVFFLHGEQLGRTTRPGTGPVGRRAAAPRRADPGRSARRASAPTSRAGTPLRRLNVSRGVATVDLGKRFLAARTRPSLLARLSQLVRTLTAPQAATRVQLLVEGHSVTGVFPGIDTSMPVSWAYLSRPNVPVPQPPPERLKPPDPHVKAAQLRLIALGYLVKGDADGRFGPVTSNALLAFEKWERLPRTGLLDPATDERLTTAARPEPVSAGAQRPARGDPARPTGHAADPGQRGHAHDRRLDRQAFDADAAGELQGLREDPEVVVDAVSGVAAAGAAVQRRHRVPPVPRRPRVRCLARLRPPAAERRALDV